MKGRRVTSHDVAERAGVSRGVVSAVLNGTPGIGVSEKKRRAVLQAIEELNYRVDAHAKGMRTGRSLCIAAFGNLHNALFLQMLQGFQEQCKMAGYHVLLYGDDGWEAGREALVDLFLQRRIDAIVTKDTTGYRDEKWIESVQRHRIPFLSVEGYPEEERVPSVLMDYKESVFTVLDYMYERQPLPPVYLEVYNGKEYQPNWGDRQRLAGYREWMARRGFTPRIVTVHEHQLRQDGGPADELLRGAGRLSVLSNWSRGAVALYRFAYRRKIEIGRELLMMAADNTERVNEHLVPSLSSVDVPYQAMGAAAAIRLIEYVDGRRPLSDTSNIWLPAQLAVRDSFQL